jgi:cytochrome c-type biogenesis protein CcmH/NrfG
MEQQFDEAVVDAKRAIAINPNFPLGYLVLAQALFAEGNPEDQIVAIRKAIRLDPGSQDVYGEELVIPG